MLQQRQQHMQKTLILGRNPLEARLYELVKISPFPYPLVPDHQFHPH